MSIDNIRDERYKIRKFITTYRDLPVLWDTKCFEYTKKDKRNKAYNTLLQVYRTLKHNATIDDVKKKINSMRSNFRKELKKVTDSANSSAEYQPTSWMYEELLFLKGLETSHWNNISSIKDDMDTTTVNRVLPMERDSEPMYVPCVSKKRTRYTETEASDPVPNVKCSACMNEADIAKIWASKVKLLEPMQGLFAEKAINDILFEAQLGTLHRHSVKINECIPLPATSLQSTPEYKYYDTPSM